MNAIVPFSFDSHQVRVVEHDGEVLFVARDVATALGYTNTREAIIDNCKKAKSLKDIGVAGGYPFADQSLTLALQTKLIPESDVFRLVMRSKLEGAERFQDWVCEEVLPSIRKTGSYTAPKAAPADRPTKVFPEYFRIAKMIGLDKNAAALSANQATHKKTGENVLALMGITHLETEQPWFTPTDLGKRINVSGRQFNLLLLESGLQTKEGDHWLPTDAAKGLFRFFDTNKRHMDGSIVLQLKWSGDVLKLINREAA